MANAITIQGLDDCLRFFDQAPENLMKVSRTAMRDGGKEVSKMARQRLPKRWRKLVRSKVLRSYKGNIQVLWGLFNGHQQQGHQNKNGAIDDWFKAYWLNYGTLANRDPEHHFQTPVKHRKTAAAARRRSTEGIKPRKFFEAAIQGWEDRFTEAFSASLKNQEDKLYER